VAQAAGPLHGTAQAQVQEYLVKVIVAVGLLGLMHPIMVLAVVAVQVLLVLQGLQPLVEMAV
jgi:hypothetical protein